jgi:hypothetical protein
LIDKPDMVDNGAMPIVLVFFDLHRHLGVRGIDMPELVQLGVQPAGSADSAPTNENDQDGKKGEAEQELGFHAEVAKRHEIPFPFFCAALRG